MPQPDMTVCFFLLYLNSRFFKRGQLDSRPVTSALENTPPEAARAKFWLFTSKTVLTTITTLGSGAAEDFFEHFGNVGTQN